MLSLYEESSICEECGRTIYRYCHSRAGTLKAYAWTDIPEDSETDPRYGTRCPERQLGRHVPGYTLELAGDPREGETR